MAVAIDRQGVCLPSATPQRPVTGMGSSKGGTESWVRFATSGLWLLAPMARDLLGSRPVGASPSLRSIGLTGQPGAGRQEHPHRCGAGRAVLAGVATAIPKTGEGEIEMIRMLKNTKDSAAKARTQAVNQMKALIVTSPSGLRATLEGSDGHCLRGAVQEPPSWSSLRRHGGSRIHTSVPCLPLHSTRQGDPRLAGRNGTTHSDGNPGCRFPD